MRKKRLIDADALCRSVERYKDSYPAAYAVISVVAAAPTIEEEPVRHGRWENPTELKPRMFERYGHTFTERQCSECKRWNISVTGSITRKYCPHCGAKMDGDEDEGD